MLRRTRGGLGALRGESLVELLVTVAILGLAVVALVGALGSSVIFSTVNREQAGANAALHSYAEAISAAVSTRSVAYVPCASTTSYQSVPGYTPPSGMSVSVKSVAYWNATTKRFAPGACAPGQDAGVQRLTLQVSGKRSGQSLDLVVRKP